MQVSEILRKMADILDQAESSEVAAQAPAEPAAEPVQEPAQLEPVTVNNTDGSDSETMVSPLQQKHELLKMATGVDNNVGEFADSEGVDELELIKQRAGIGAKQGNGVAPEADINPKKNAALAFFNSDTDTE